MNPTLTTLSRGVPASLAQSVACALVPQLVHGMRGELLNWSPALTQTTGVAPKRGQSLSELLLATACDRGEAQRSAERWRDALASEALRSWQLDVSTLEGPRRWLWHVTHALKRERIYVWTAVDIDAVVREGGAAEALRVSEARARAATSEVAEQAALFDAVLDAAPVGIIIAAPDGKMIRMNPANERLWGKAPYSVRADYQDWKGWWADGSARQGQPVAPEDWVLARALRGETVPGDIVEIEPFDEPGMRRTILNSGAPVRDRQGRILGAVVTQMDISARVAAEAARRESEARFRTLADSIPQLAWIAEADGSIHWYNRRWYEYTGCNAAEMEADGGWGWQRVHDPAELPRVIANFQRALAAGEPWEDMFPLRRSDGEFRWHLSRAMPLRDETGRIVRWFGTNTDVTETLRAQEATRQSEARLRTLVESNIIGIIFFDVDGEVREANDAFLRMVGYSRDDLRAGRLHWNALTPPEWRAQDAELLAELERMGKHRLAEKKFLRKDGSRLPLMVASTLFPDSRTEGIGFVLDISAQKRAQAEQRRYAERLEGMHAIDLAVLQMLPERAIAQVALAALQRLMPCDCVRLVLLDETPGRARLLEAKQGVEKLYERELPVSALGTIDHEQRSVGEVFELRSAGAPDEAALSRHGLRYGLRVALRVDHRLAGCLELYTRRRQELGPRESEVAVEAANHLVIGLEHARMRTHLRGEAERLEDEVKRRTSELREANAELESFSYSVSHDLRAPLRAIAGFTQAIEDDPGNVLTPRSARFFQKVRGAASRMAELIDDLLKLSRISRAELRRTPVDISDLAQQVAHGLRMRAPERSVEVCIADGMRASADAGLLRVVLENLLGNAWKFTSKQPAPWVAVRTSQRGGETVFEVCDNGVGFDMSHAEKLFGAFQRLHHDDEFPGSGIGLATVQRIVHRHGGRIWAESRPDHGASFFFTLGGAP